MTKLEFLLALQERLSALPKEEVKEHLAFYDEMIDDRIEDGLTQEEAAAAVGSVEEIAEQILGTIPENTPVRQKRKWAAWEITLLILGSPVWFSLLVAAFAVVLSAIVSLWSVFAALAASGVGFIVSGIGMMIAGHALPGVAAICIGMVCGGLSIFTFYGASATTRTVIAWIKKYFFTGKENG